MMLRPQITINNKYIASSISNNIKFIFFALVLIIYFAWMDIALFIHVQRWTIPPIRKDDSIITKKILNKTNGEIYDYPIKVNKPKDDSYKNFDQSEALGTFNPLSIKLIMLDHGTHYIHDIIARFLESTFQFTSLFPWVTPDLVSFTGLIISFISCKFILSEKRSHNQIGAILFEVRNLADAMDGVVYRSRANIRVFLRSNSSSHGYQIDAICDSIAGFAIVVTIFFKILRHPPHKDRTPDLITINYKSLNRESKCSNKDDSENCSKYQLLKENYIDGNIHEYNENLNENISNNISLSGSALISTELNHSNVYSLNQEQFSNNRTMSIKLIFAYVFFFGIRLLLSSAMWNHFMQNYQDLLMNFSQNPIQRKMQGEAFKSVGFWLIMWFWKVGNACAILEHLTIVTFFDKQWDYIYYSAYIGWVFLVGLSFITQIHYYQLYSMITVYGPLG